MSRTVVFRLMSAAEIDVIYKILSSTMQDIFNSLKLNPYLNYLNSVFSYLKTNSSGNELMYNIPTQVQTETHKVCLKKTPK